MGAPINLWFSADVRSETGETAEYRRGRVRCTDKINGGMVKNDDAAVRKDSGRVACTGSNAVYGSVLFEIFRRLGESITPFWEHVN